METFWVVVAVIAVLGFIASRKWPEVTTAIGVALAAGVAAFWDSIAPMLPFVGGG